VKGAIFEANITNGIINQALFDLKTYEHCYKPKHVRRKLFVTERKDRVIMNKDYLDHRALIKN